MLILSQHFEKAKFLLNQKPEKEWASDQMSMNSDFISEAERINTIGAGLNSLCADWRVGSKVAPNTFSWFFRYRTHDNLTPGRSTESKLFWLSICRLCERGIDTAFMHKSFHLAFRWIWSWKWNRENWKWVKMMSIWGELGVIEIVRGSWRDNGSWESLLESV